jgi:hypothetical protein
MAEMSNDARATVALALVRQATDASLPPYPDVPPHVMEVLGPFFAQAAAGSGEPVDVGDELIAVIAVLAQFAGVMFAAQFARGGPQPPKDALLAALDDLELGFLTDGEGG